MSQFEAFETPLGARETDRHWRGMVARARHEYLVRLMPVWAGVLTFATLLLGLPGLYLLGRALGLADNASIQTALLQGPLASSLQLIAAWLQPLADTLSPTQNRFGLEAFIIGLLLSLGVASILRAVGSRQWFQSVYDDLPRRRLMLTLVLWLVLPVMVAFLLLFFGALVEATALSPRIVLALVAVVVVVMLTLCLLVLYLTFSVREPAIPSMLVGALCAALGLVLGYGLLSLIPGLSPAIAATAPAEATISPLRALVTLSVYLFVFWSVVLAGSQLAVALARRHDPIERFVSAGRGEQLDFALSLIRDIEDQTRSRRWALTRDLARSLTAPTAMVTFALDRLRRAGIVGYADDGTRPPARWAIQNDLESLTLNDLSRAMGTALDPHPGLHGRAQEEVIADLAAREHLSQSQNLLSLFRQPPDLPPVGEPMLAVDSATYSLDDVDGFAPSSSFQPVARVVDRGEGDNGGPPEDEDGDIYVFVDGNLKDDIVLNMQAGPSALYEQDDDEMDGFDDDIDDDADGNRTGGARGKGKGNGNGNGNGTGKGARRSGGQALDLTQAMRLSVSGIVDDRDLGAGENAETDPDPALEPIPAEAEEPPTTLRLGAVSPLAAVREEIDHLIEHGVTGATAPPAEPPLAPLARWRAGEDQAAADDPLPHLDFIPALQPQSLEPLASWRMGRRPAEVERQSEPFVPLPAQRSWRRDASRPLPTQAWKQAAPTPAGDRPDEARADQAFVPFVSQPATIEPSRRFDFSAKSPEGES